MEGKKGAEAAISAEITVRFRDRKTAGAAFRSLACEGNVSGRCRSETRLGGDAVRISAHADDVVALRATLNGFLRALQVFEGIEKETLMR